MRWTLANRMSVGVVGVIGLAVVSSTTAFLALWHVNELMDLTLEEYLPSVRAAEELEIAVLEQRGFVSSYLLDRGNRYWLEELEKRKGSFHEGLNAARAASSTREEHAILDKLEMVFGQYAATRGEVVALFDRGEVEAAEKLLIHRMTELFGQAYNLCEEFIAINIRYVDTAAADARRQARTVTITVACCALLTVVLGSVVLWLFIYRIVFPVRALVADAQGFSADAAQETEPLPVDEFRAMGVYLRGLMSDVEDRQTSLDLSRRQLSDANKLASVGKLAASVAHEIRNPLTAIRMWLFAIHKEVGGGESVDRKFKVVSEELTRLERIVRDFLDFARPPQLQRVSCSISEILDTTLELLRPRLADDRIEVVRCDEPGLPRVNADAEQLKQVLLNLIGNARDAVAGGGRIHLRTRSETEPDGRKTVTVRISDTGVGIRPDVQARIFEPFFSTKERGTGLGLCIAARIMAGHEGRLVLESSSERGTTFALHVPAFQVTRP